MSELAVYNVLDSGMNLSIFGSTRTSSGFGILTDLPKNQTNTRNDIRLLKPIKLNDNTKPKYRPAAAYGVVDPFSKINLKKSSYNHGESNKSVKNVRFEQPKRKSYFGLHGELKNTQELSDNINERIGRGNINYVRKDESELTKSDLRTIITLKDERQGDEYFSVPERVDYPMAADNENHNMLGTSLRNNGVVRNHVKIIADYIDYYNTDDYIDRFEDEIRESRYESI